MNLLIRLTVIAVLALVPFTVCADQSGPNDRQVVDIPFYQYERFLISGQPDEDALRQSSENGVGIVINLRGESESDWDEERAAESVGLEYHQVPVNGMKLSSETFEEISAIVDANPDSSVLIHCASGNRAAAWLAVYLAESRGVPASEALDIARSKGLTNAGLEERVAAYLGE